MDPEMMQAIRRLADGKDPIRDWPLRANHVTDVAFVGIRGRKGPVHKWVIHPPRIGEHIQLYRLSKDASRSEQTYYEVIDVVWEVRDGPHYTLYRPGDEAEWTAMVFVKPVKNSLGQQFDRAQRAEWAAKRRRRAAARRIPGNAVA
jgi:hypothetical protein